MNLFVDSARSVGLGFIFGGDVTIGGADDFGGGIVAAETAVLGGEVRAISGGISLRSERGA